MGGQLVANKLLANVVRKTLAIVQSNAVLLFLIDDEDLVYLCGKQAGEMCIGVVDFCQFEPEQRFRFNESAIAQIVCANSVVLQWIDDTTCRLSHFEKQASEELPFLCSPVVYKQRDELERIISAETVGIVYAFKPRLGKVFTNIQKDHFEILAEILGAIIAER